MEQSEFNINLDKSLFKCHHCLSEYGKDDLSTPRVLPHCGHTLCYSCIKNIMEKDKYEAKCPIDFKKLFNPGLSLSKYNIENFFQKNKLVVNIIEQIASQKEIIVPCEVNNWKGDWNVPNVEPDEDTISVNDNRYVPIVPIEPIEEDTQPVNKYNLEYFLSDETWEKCLQNVPDAEKLINNLVDLGFAKPSKIQSKTIPFAMTERNVGILVQSPSGSGKTLGFATLAILRVDPAKPLHQNGNQTLYYPQVIILTPTVELSTQIVKVVQMIAKPFQNIKVSSGKVAAHIVVRTPKSLLKLMADKNVDLSNVALCVVDEADELLQGESGQYLLELIKKIPKYDASLGFFSATCTEESVSYISSFFKLLKITLVMRYMFKPEELNIDKDLDDMAFY